jgi:hydrogenase maturation protease
MTEIKRKVILGLGNTLNRDEGLGVHALKLLETQLDLPAEVEVLDGGTLGLNLLPLVEECSHLLLLDATNAGQPAGTLIELQRDQIPLYSGVKMSEHQITFQEVLGLAKVRGRLPEQLHLIGVQPADLGIGTELSPIVAARLPDMIERTRAVLQDWQLIATTNRI